MARVKPFIRDADIAAFYRAYRGYRVGEEQFEDLKPQRIKKGISDTDTFMRQLRRRIRKLSNWVVADQAKQRPWEESFAESILQEIKLFEQRVENEYESEQHMMDLRTRIYLPLRPTKYSLYGFTMQLLSYIERRMQLPEGRKEEFTNLLIAAVMVAGTVIAPIDARARNFGAGVKNRIRQQIYYARNWSAECDKEDNPGLGPDSPVIPSLVRD